MNYEKMSKAELIEICKNSKHMATTIEQKDKEINRLKTFEGLDKKYQELSDENKKLKNDVSRLRLDLDSLSQTREKDVHKHVSGAIADYDNKLKEAHQIIEELKTYAQRRETELNKYVNSFGDVLKTLQGTVDIGVRLNSYMLSDVKKQ